MTSDTAGTGRRVRPLADVRLHDWTTLASLLAFVGAVVSALRRRGRRARRLAAFALAADLAGRWSSRRRPGPFPARFRAVLVHPKGDLSRLVGALEPAAGDRVLEIGPGGGHHAVEVARHVAPGGRVDVLDLQPAMIEAVDDRAHRAGVSGTVVGTVADACAPLPFPDGTFDRAYLNGVLGELPRPDVTLAELRRVMKPGGRFVVGEVLFDPDFVGFGTLTRRATQAGFALEGRKGTPVAYYATFTAA